MASDIYQAGLLANSPKFELEADYYAALILENARIDLIHGRNLLIRLARVADSSTQNDWGIHGRLMATTHPANDRRIATWMAISDSLGRSRQASFSQDDAELRWSTLAELLKDPLIKGKTERWINSRNGHSGTMKILEIRGMVKCRTPSYFAQCVKYRQQDYSMDLKALKLSTCVPSQ